MKKQQKEFLHNAEKNDFLPRQGSLLDEPEGELIQNEDTHERNLNKIPELHEKCMFGVVGIETKNNLKKNNELDENK